MSILAISAAVGVGIYYASVFGYYEEVAVKEVQLTSLVSGQPETIPTDDFEGFNADTSPIRYRACFTTPLSTALLTETYETFEGAVPLNAPDWFDCFNADNIAASLDEGSATAYLGHGNIEYGVDRVVVIADDGRGYVWQQLNDCGEKLYDGTAADEDCPEREN